jgi:hypothetical protein
MRTINTSKICDALTNQDIRTEVEKQFYGLLAERFRGNLREKAITAGGIAVVCACFLYDVRHGKCGFTYHDLHPTLRGLPPTGIFVMFVQAKQIILANVPEDDRSDVEKALCDVQ